LLRKGFEVEVYEAAPELREIGAGVSLGANAMKALRSLDLEKPVREVGWEGDYSYLRNGKTGHAISKTPITNRYGAAGCSVHRADWDRPDAPLLLTMSALPGTCSRLPLDHRPQHAHRPAGVRRLEQHLDRRERALVEDRTQF